MYSIQLIPISEVVDWSDFPEERDDPLNSGVAKRMAVQDVHAAAVGVALLLVTPE
jgi:hypothetical protein